MWTSVLRLLFSSGTGWPFARSQDVINLLFHIAEINPGTPTWASQCAVGGGDPGRQRGEAPEGIRAQPTRCSGSAGTCLTCAPQTGERGVLRPRDDAFLQFIHLPKEPLLPMEGGFRSQIALVSG